MTLQQTVNTQQETGRRDIGGEQTSRQVLARIGAVAAVIGAVFMFLSTMLHPAGSHPNDHRAAFTEYAADSFWVWSHLGQFIGVTGLAIALVALGTSLEAGRPAAWGRIGLVGTAAFITVAAMLQAVDGVALKMMVDHWAAATGESRTSAFEATFAVRQVEIGIASFFSLLSGLTVSVFGLAMILSKRYPVWLGILGLVAAAGTLAGGLSQATTGFSDLAMALSMPSGFLLMLWAILTGISMWQLVPKLAETYDPV